MTHDLLQRTVSLRDEAWQSLTNSPVFQQLMALDVAVGVMGGQRILNDESLMPVVGVRKIAEPLVSPRRRLSQGDVAADNLRQAGEPMPIRQLLEAVIASGVEIRGEDPLANFRSTLSRDDRFQSVMRNGGYYWWLTGVDFPKGWKEAADPDLPGLSAAPNSQNQEGGGGHAANNTFLAS